jgi:hypothetical protein
VIEQEELTRDEDYKEF